LEQPFRPWSCGIDDEARANIEALSVDAVAGSDAGDARVGYEQAFGFDVICYARAELGGGGRESEHESRGTEHLPVLKHCRAGQTLELDRGEERTCGLATEEFGAADPACRIQCVSIDVCGEGI